MAGILGVVDAAGREREVFSGHNDKHNEKCTQESNVRSVSITPQTDVSNQLFTFAPKTGQCAPVLGV